MPKVIVDESRPPAWSPERKLLRILAKIPDSQVRCRSGKHKWASEQQEEPGDPFPREVVAHRREGRYLIEDPCLRCDAEKHTLTGEDGDLYTARSWIIYPNDWETIPAEFPHSKIVLKMEWSRRTKRAYGQLLREADREEAAIQRAEEREARARVQPVEFRSAGAG